MIEHLIDTPLDPLHVEGEHPEHDVAEMADTGKGDQPLKIGLHHRYQGPINDPDDGQYTDQGEEGHSRLGKQGHCEADKPICSHFQQNAG